MIGLKGFATIWIENADGSRSLIADCEDGPKPNRILDSGLDMPASYIWAGLFRVFSIGTDNSATVDTMTKLVSYLSHTGIDGYISGECGTNVLGFDNIWKAETNSASPPVRLFRTSRVWINNTGSSVSIGELGFGPDDSSDPDLFSRIALATPVAVADGLGIIVRYTLEIDYSFYWNSYYTIELASRGYGPIRTTQLGEIGDLWVINDLSYTGENISSACVLGVIDDAGIDSDQSSDPSRRCEHSALEPSRTSLGKGSAIVTTTTSSLSLQPSKLAYTSGSHAVVWRLILDDASIVGNITQIRLKWYYVYNYTASDNSIYFEPDSPITKALGETLTHDFVISWGRA